MDKSRDFLATEPVGKLLFRLALPTVVAQIVNLLYTIVDRIYIGQYDTSGMALAGLGICFPIITLISAFSSLIGMGGAPRASIAMGQKDMDKAQKIIGNCFSALLFISVALTLVQIFFSRQILEAFGASETTIVPAMQYLSIYMYGTLFVQLVLGMNTFIAAQGFTKISMTSVLIGAVTNIVLDPILIFVLDMGVYGAALATIIAQAVSATWVVMFLLSKKSVLRIQLKNMNIQWKYLAPCLALGVSPFFMSMTESIVTISFNTSLLKYGGDIAVGSVAIVVTIMQLITVPLLGITQGAQPITSYNYGAGNYSRVRQTFKILLISALTFTTTMWLLVMAFPELFVRMFNNGNPELIAYASTALRIYVGSGLLLGAQLACQQTFLALGNAKISLFLAALRKVILLIPLIFIMPILMDPNDIAVFLAEPIADFLAVAGTVTVFYMYYKRVLCVPDKKQG